MRLPGRGSSPAVDDHLVVPEVTRDEIIAGRKVVAFPAEAPHGDKQVDLDFLLRSHVAPGYVVSADLITRFAVDSDFASDTCVRREGTDPATGRRYLEEIAFEWSAESESWRPLEEGSQIEDRCLGAPLPVKALLDAALVHEAAVQALDVQGNPAIQKLKETAEARGVARGIAEGRAEGRAEGMATGTAEAILAVLEERGITVSPAQREEILGCSDLDLLKRWLREATLPTTTEASFARD
jgi:hypothetical protein